MATFLLAVAIGFLLGVTIISALVAGSDADDANERKETEE